jgi:hypothetical protein
MRVFRACLIVLTLSLAATAYANSISVQSVMHRDLLLENKGMSLAPVTDDTSRGISMEVHPKPTHGHDHGKIHPHSVPEPNPALLFLFSLVPFGLIGVRRLHYKK